MGNPGWGYVMADPRNLDEIATEAWSFSLDQGIINSASWSPNGTLLVLNCFKDFLVVLDGETGEEVKRLDGLTYSRNKSFWSRDGSLLFSYIHNEIRVWDIETWRVVRRIEMWGYADSFGVDPHGSMVATGYDVDRGLGGYGRVDLWRTTDGSKVASIETKNSVRGVSLSPSGQLATWSNGRFVHIWDVDDESSVVQTLEIKKGMPTRTIWNPSESSIVVATNTAEIYVFDAESGEERFHRDAHCEKHSVPFGVYALGFSSDETWFASKDGDGKVLVWRTTDWLPLAVFQSKTLNWSLRGPPLLAIKPNESTILTQDEDCSGLKVWHLHDRVDEPSTTSVYREERIRGSMMSDVFSEKRPYEPFVISLCELERLGSFTRWQDIRERLRNAERERGPLHNYPLFRGWSEPDSDIDVFDGSSCKRVRFRAWDGKRITYEH
jgi:WD40 repeat protein